MNNKIYFIKLTPLQLFFFGREQNEMADYFIKGNFLPQQTALLGLIRHQVLLQNNLITNNKINNDIEAVKWIGAKGFEYNDREQKFGKIISLSPLHLVRTENKIEKLFLPYHQPYVNSIKKLDNNYYLPDYDPKNDYPDIWKSIDKKETLSNCKNEIYEEIIQPGVDKHYLGLKEDNEDGYYKQVWLKMKSRYSFGFYVELSQDVKLETTAVFFGKESSPFFMQVTAPGAPQTFRDDIDSTAILLTSDAQVDRDILSACDFAITNCVPFRNIVSRTSVQTNYYQWNKSNNKSRVRLQLLKRGSILFAKGDKLTNIKAEIENQKNFKKIGYNHFHLLQLNY